MGLEQQPSPHFKNGLKIVASVGFAFLATTASGRGPELQSLPVGTFNHQPDLGSYDLVLEDKRYFYLDKINPAQVRDFYGRKVYAKVFITGPHTAVVSKMDLAEKSRP